ncbi:BnaCnng75150D [Brassica napus]|uniref:BnaCnng75150D protein n=1 Tax=Brassica napus TaxID=3708 RepID=A0A078K2B6_BRANA|nr:BnaCnng75150D [Brassica napus]
MSGASATAMDLEGELGDSTEIENLVNGLEHAMDLVGNGNSVGDNVTMKLDGSVAIEGRKEELSEGVDDFQALTDEETVKTDEDMRGVAEGEEELGGNGDQDVQAGEEEKKKGARKVLFKKPPGIAIGTSKLRLVQAVLSPRKNGASKSSKRQGGGEGSKQTEEKGPLNPKNSAKPG